MLHCWKEACEWLSNYHIEYHFLWQHRHFVQALEFTALPKPLQLLKLYSTSPLLLSLPVDAQLHYQPAI
jgi:hypothetical protein